MTRKTVLRVAFFAATGAAWPPLCVPYLNKANELLNPWNITIQDFPAVSQGTSPLILPNLSVNTAYDTIQDMLRIREACAAVLTADHGVPVVFCEARGMPDQYGNIVEAPWIAITVNPGTYSNSGDPINVTWPSFVLINTLMRGLGDHTLCHELIHAAGAPDDYSSNSDVMYYQEDKLDPTKVQAPVKVNVTQKEATLLRRAYFARTT